MNLPADQKTRGIEMRHEPRSWLSRGYGLAPQLLMMDRSISAVAKALFCYISSIAGSATHPDFGGPASWPTRERICADLGISKDTFTKYLRELKDAGYIRVEQKRDKGERFARNVYVICDIIYPREDQVEPCPKKPDTAKSDSEEPCPKLSDPETPDTEKSDTKNSNRSLTNNQNQTNTRQDSTVQSRLLLCFEIHMERKPSKSEQRTLTRLAETYDIEWVEMAFTEYDLQTDFQEIKHPLRYIEGVLENWKVEGVKTTDVLEHLRKLQTKRGKNRK